MPLTQDLFVKETSVKSKVLDLLKSKEWVYCDDFEKIFPPKTEGHLSWAQRLRELRSEGFIITKRPKINCKHTWEYSLQRENNVH